jgi:hypothetical protein
VGAIFSLPLIETRLHVKALYDSVRLTVWTEKLVRGREEMKEDF